jgi:hypothetical protein
LSARGPLEHRKSKQSLAILESNPDTLMQFLTLCVNKVQYNIYAWLDDVMELEMEEIKPNLRFYFLLLLQMCWSKNVNKECNAGKQIYLGEIMKRKHCYIVLVLAIIFLEVWFDDSDGVLGMCFSSIMDDDPIKSKKKVADIMEDVYKHKDFG